MLQISPVQSSALRASSETEFLTQVVADWMAIHERVEGRPARMPFEAAWSLGDAVLSRIDERGSDLPEGALRRLLHRLFGAAELGSAPAVLRGAADTFLTAMPCEAAGHVLLDAGLA